MSEKPGVLFVSYDGMLEPLGQSQVIPYLFALADEYRIHVLSFEKPRDLNHTENRADIERRFAARGVHWHPMRYHKRPPLLSTVWDMARGAIACMRIAKRERISVFHGRSIICGAMLCPAARALGGETIADIRGFWVDERVDGGIIARDGLTHRVLKPIEKSVLRSADRIITLTQSSVPYLREDPRFGQPQAPIEVIPTCANLGRFRVQGDLQRKPFTLGYVGSVGTWYLLDEMLKSFLFLREMDADAKLLVVNRNEHSMIRQRASDLGINAQALEIVASSHDEMPGQIARMTAGMALIDPCFSKIASAPTKLAEYLGCGVPCFGNVGVGDVGPLLNGERVGVAVDDLGDASLRGGVRRLVDLCGDPEIQARCRGAAVRHFSLDSGVASYRSIYRALTNGAARKSECM